MGKCELSMKNDQKALECFLNASRNNLKTDIGISSVIETASIYSNKLQFKDAINILDQAVGAQPSSNRTPELLFLKGVNEERDNEQSAAFNTLNRIIDEYQGSVFVEKAKVEVGLIELQRKNIESAQKYFKEVAEKRPDDTGAEAQYYYGASLYDQDKIQEAITELVRVRSVYSLFDEWYTRSLLMLGNCYIKLNDKKQARDMFKTVLSKHPTGEFAQEAKRKLNKL